MNEGPSLVLFFATIGRFLGPLFHPLYRCQAKQEAEFWSHRALNFFLGRALVGWVVALVWAISKDANVGQPPPPVILNAYVPPLAPSAQKKCPDCAKTVLIEAKKCRFCGHEFRTVFPLVSQ
jgi:hypothetical protein